MDFDLETWLIDTGAVVISKRHDKGANSLAVQAFQVDDDTKLKGAISKFLENLFQQILSSQVVPSAKGKLQVFVLGRYKIDRQYIPEDWEQNYGKHLTLRFSSVHGSKGLEADYVILP